VLHEFFRGGLCAGSHLGVFLQLALMLQLCGKDHLAAAEERQAAIIASESASARI